ncbi:MAG TPA: hypothetical protein QF487_06415, partial [Acidimicrobiales bacterium]|nr:hypothetical protein [Acidimicrobiales bacterium]
VCSSDLWTNGRFTLVVGSHTGLAEAMRLVNPLGRLSRGIAGTRGQTLILNTPGSAKGSVECLEAVIDVVSHAVRLLVDNADPHPTSS